MFCGAPLRQGFAPYGCRLRRPCLHSRPSRHPAGSAIAGSAVAGCARCRRATKPMHRRDPHAWSVIVKLDNVPKLYYSGTTEGTEGKERRRSAKRREGWRERWTQ